MHLIHSKEIQKGFISKNFLFEKKQNLHTALLVFISIDERRYSKTFSRFPARAARKKPEFPSDYNKIIIPNINVSLQHHFFCF